MPLKKYKNIFLVFLFSLGMALACYAQEPPPPGKARGHGPPCDPGTTQGNPQRPGIPPPVGLCLPIDDYVYLLMAVGVMYGCYKMRKIDISGG
ncbi:hypothetical protein C7S20_05400 [Christiangramia fulva]|uniref:Lipoprotein n=1 Tax=Christiangramia fulva TaxID=2126553 RepID=A0A2R3Z3A7_9FLAO|nr:hypothetical protein [Christiangramia fulva]AVR44745.1 hypothetical protein C7S20_05400 [Christiangramia fulva]